MAAAPASALTPDARGVAGPVAVVGLDVPVLVCAEVAAEDFVASGAAAFEGVAVVMVGIPHDNIRRHVVVVLVDGGVAAAFVV